VRQLANRLVRSVPENVQDPVRFRAALQEAIANAPQVGLRFGIGELPTEHGGTDSLVSVEASPDGTGLVLETSVMGELVEVVEERQRAPELMAAGLSLTRTLLLSGPPGVGKTMAAQWIAQAVGVPLVSVNLASLVSSFLGSSGRNIRSALEYAKSGQCVMLLDEFDAIAKRRNDETDIGELKRIVNVILLELDRWPDDNLLVAATNHLQLLDEAVDRRFDRHIVFGLPGALDRRAILEHLSAGTVADGDRVIPLIADLTRGWSGSDLKRLWDLGMRRAVLNNSEPSDQLLRTLAQRIGGQRRERDLVWLALAERLDMSSRQIASITGVSHPTVSAGLKRAREGPKQ
jgi:SpoVK/Ycf46/Vps4 family AAA+-type ATPase